MKVIRIMCGVAGGWYIVWLADGSKSRMSWREVWCRFRIDAHTAAQPLDWNDL